MLYPSRFLNHFEPGRSYRLALAYELPEDLNGRIAGLRKALEAYVCGGQQLVPHITLLYFGSRSASAIQRIALISRTLPQQQVRFATGRLGAFFRGDRICNIHLRVHGTAELAAAQSELLRRLTEIYEPVDTQFAARAYRPHISLFDLINSYQGPMLETYPEVPDPWQGLTHGLRLLGRPDEDNLLSD